MITFSFLNQTLWCDSHWNHLSETIPMSGNITGLAFWKTINFRPYLLPCLNTGMPKMTFYKMLQTTYSRMLFCIPAYNKGCWLCCRIVMVFLRVSCGECSSGCWVVGHVSGLSPGRWGGGGCRHPSCKYIHKKVTCTVKFWPFKVVGTIFASQNQPKAEVLRLHFKGFW